MTITEVTDLIKSKITAKGMKAGNSFTEEGLLVVRIVKAGKNINLGSVSFRLSDLVLSNDEINQILDGSVLDAVRAAIKDPQA